MLGQQGKSENGTTEPMDRHLEEIEVFEVLHLVKSFHLILYFNLKIYFLRLKISKKKKLFKISQIFFKIKNRKTTKITIITSFY